MIIKHDVMPMQINDSILVRADFDEGLRTLKREGYRLISVEENAILRMQQSCYPVFFKDIRGGNRAKRVRMFEKYKHLWDYSTKEIVCCEYGNFVSQGILYVPNKGIFLTNNSPVLDNPEKATQALKQRKEYYISSEQIEKGLADSVEILPIGSKIPLKRFGEDPATVFLFGKHAKDYGEFLEKTTKEGSYPNGRFKEDPTIEKYFCFDLSYINKKKKKPFANQLYFDEFRERKSNHIIGDNNLIRFYCSVRGIK